MYVGSRTARSMSMRTSSRHLRWHSISTYGHTDYGYGIQRYEIFKHTGTYIPSSDVLSRSVAVFIDVAVLSSAVLFTNNSVTENIMGGVIVFVVQICTKGQPGLLGWAGSFYTYFNSIAVLNTAP